MDIANPVGIRSHFLACIDIQITYLQNADKNISLPSNDMMALFAALFTLISLAVFGCNCTLFPISVPFELHIHLFTKIFSNPLILSLSRIVE